MIYKHFQITEADGAVLEIQDLLQVHLHNDNLKTFMNDWGMTLFAMHDSHIPSDAILESLFRRQINNHRTLREHMAWYDR